MSLQNDSDNLGPKYPVNIQDPDQLIAYATKTAKYEKDIARGKAKPELLRAPLSAIIYDCLNQIYERQGASFIESWDMYNDYRDSQQARIESLEKNARKVFGPTQYNVLWARELVDLINRQLEFQDPSELPQKQAQLANAISDVNRTSLLQQTQTNPMQVRQWQDLELIQQIRGLALLLLNRSTYANQQRYDSSDKKLLFLTLSHFLQQLTEENELTAAEARAQQQRQLRQ